MAAGMTKPMRPDADPTNKESEEEASRWEGAWECAEWPVPAASLEEGCRVWFGGGG